MKQKVMLSIHSRQTYRDQDPEEIELVTPGEMEFVDGGWNIRYEESEMTGLEGVWTVFRVEREKIILTRTGALRSTMEFQMGVSHDSLYQLEFGALMVTVTATQMFYDILPEGGSVDLVYNIEIENMHAGVVEYHLDIRAAA